MTWNEIDWTALERLRAGFLHGAAAEGALKPVEAELAVTGLAGAIGPAPVEVKANASGRVLHEIVGSSAELKEREVAEGDTGTAGSAAIPGIPGMGNEAAVTDTEADEMEEHLRGLGYIE